MIDKIMTYESGEMDDDEVIELFQELVNTGLCWQLQGSYGRMAERLINRGLVTVPSGPTPTPLGKRIEL